MTPERQRIAIAEACGWVNVATFDHGVYGDDPNRADGIMKRHKIPNYPASLDAMHEAEEVLRNNQFHWVHYPEELFRVVTGMKWTGDMGYFFPCVVRATATQRAEAFLRAVSKWEES